MRLIWQSPRWFKHWGLFLRTPTRRIRLFGW
jgi:hypothetical protein